MSHCELKDWTCAAWAECWKFGSLIYHLGKKWKLYASATLFFFVLSFFDSIEFFVLISIIHKFNKNLHFLKITIIITWRSNPASCCSTLIILIAPCKIAWWHILSSNWNIPIFSFHLNYILILVKTKEVFILPAYSDYNCSSGCFCNRDFN